MTRAQRREKTLERIRLRILGLPIFLTGDRVLVKNNQQSGYSFLDGKMATIATIDQRPAAFGLNIGIMTDFSNSRQHDLAGHCPMGHGWWVSAGDLELVERVENIHGK